MNASFDVVIVGGGAAGLWAAVQAYDNNLSAIVLEKQPEESAGGDVRCCGGSMQWELVDGALKDYSTPPFLSDGEQ